jgi:hypothetical protein
MTLRDFFQGDFSDPCPWYWDDEAERRCDLGDDEFDVIIDPVSCMVVAIIPRSARPKLKTQAAEPRSWRRRLTHCLTLLISGVPIIELE